jgi:zinc transport system ATP-binding protein
MTQLAPNRLIDARGIQLSFGERDILKGVDLVIDQGEIVTLIGPNGAGKTSLVKVVLGLLKPTCGELARQKKLRIGYMPQKLHIEPSLPLTVKRFLSLAASVREPELLDALTRVGIERLLHNPIQLLSGGETQRVLLARAILRKPELLVLDEPVQGVDVAGQAELYRLINQLRDQLNCGVLMVSHDLHLVMANTDTVVCLNKHVCCHGHPEKVSNHPAYLELFGATAHTDIAVYTHNHDHSHDMHGNVVTSDSNSDHSSCNHNL